MQPQSMNSNPAQPAGTPVPVRRAAPAGGAAAPAASAPEPTFDNGPSVVGGKGNRKTGWILAIILLLLIAAGGVGFGVWAWMDGNTQREQLNAQVNDLQQENAELQEQLASGGSTTGTGTGSGTEGEIVNTSDYIYVGEWGIKIKIPENIQVASYEISNWDSDNSAGTALCVSGSTSGHDGATPSFLSGTAENRYTDKLKVCLEKNTRATSEEEGGFMYETIPVGQYYIVGPQAIIGDGSDSDWEVESADALKAMLEDENNRFAI